MVAGTRLRRPPAHPSPSLSSGIGKEVAATFARRGATVVLACRSPDRGEALVAELEAEAVASRAPRPSLRVARLDVADLASVRSFARSWGDNPLHALVNNAGIFVMGDAARRETADGAEAHSATNHLGHFLLTLLLLPALRATGVPTKPAHVVHVASKLHEFARGEDLAADPFLRRAYTPLAAYARSKLAQVVFAAELRRRLRGGEGGASGPGAGRVARRVAAASAGPPSSLPPPSVVVTAVHPGEVATNVVRSLPAWMVAAYRALMGAVLLTPAQGARSAVWAATTPSGPAAADPALCYSGPECALARPAKDALDPALGRWLWGWSVARVGGMPDGVDLAPVA